MIPHRILVIDDDPDIGDIVCLRAEGLGLSCWATTDAQAFLNALAPEITLVVIDLMMPGIDGVEILRQLAERKCEAGIILTSGIGWRVVETAKELAISLGLVIAGHLLKPFRTGELDAILVHWLPPVRKASANDSFPLLSDEDLRRALRKPEFVLHYQPQIDITTKKLTGIEALIRWYHPTLGVLSPEAFLPKLEDLGLMGEVTWLVTDLGLRDLRGLQGGARTPSLSINVSASCLHDLTFPDYLADLLAVHKVEAERLTLEITETLFLGDLERSLDVLSRLRMKGIQLSIDDFGTGYAMMQQLRRIPATELKLDKS